MQDDVQRLAETPFLLQLEHRRLGRSLDIPELFCQIALGQADDHRQQVLDALALLG